MLAAYQEYAAFMPAAAWEAYARDITNVRGRLAESELIVAEVNGRIVGAVTFYPHYRGPMPADQPSGWAGFRLLAVHPDARGRGIGRALSEECVRRARERGATAVVVHTTELMAIARGLYERMGFVRAPELDHDPAPGVRILAYRLDLSPERGDVLA